MLLSTCSINSDIVPFDNRLPTPSFSIYCRNPSDQIPLRHCPSIEDSERAGGYQVTVMTEKVVDWTVG